MKAIQCVKPGEPFQMNDVPIPRPEKGQVLIKVKYAALNPMDPKVVKFNPFKLSLPITIGWDVAGTVTEVGENVKRFSVGDEVFGLLPRNGGGFAEFAVTEDFNLAKRVNMPEDVAAASGVVFGTAYNPLYIEENLNKRKGQTIFIAGGGGGIGHLAIQLAKWSGLRVITSASKPESLQLCRECGADHVINYQQSDVVAEVMKLTNNEGVDIAFDSTYDNSAMTQSATLVKKGGTWMRVGGLAWNHAGTNDEEARVVCQQRGVSARQGDLGRYWDPSYQSRLHEVSEMFEICDKLYKEGISARVVKTVPFDLQSVINAEEDNDKRKIFGKWVIKIH